MKDHKCLRLAQLEKQIDNATMQKATTMYEAKILGKYHKLYITPFFRRISKSTWSMPYKIFK